MPNMLKKVFNWSEVHLSEMTCYKIHTLVNVYASFSSIKEKITLLTFVYKYKQIISLVFQQIRLGHTIHVEI